MKNMYKGLTALQCTKMGADSLAENTPNASKKFSPICLPTPKSFGCLKKKLSLGVRSPCAAATFFVGEPSVANCIDRFL